MDWGTILAGIIGVISGNLTAFLFFPQTKKMKQLENDVKQSEEWKKLYEETQTNNKNKDDKIDSLYMLLEQYRQQEMELRTKKEELGLENIKLKILKCEVPACQKRTPPTGF